ncbi:MAG: YaaA family protein [Muribaculaceae bacterium]|nr:YaaA family protein [Muribaculaceae bacterium]
MQIIIAPAKLMIENPADCPLLGNNTPMFQSDADHIAAAMCDYNVDQLADMLHINKELAIAAHRRYNDFFDPETRRAAVSRYDGIVFKKIEAESLTPDQLGFADSHLNICSFLYGLLRPLDAINPYRLEGNVVLPAIGNISIFDYWKPRLTDELIRRVKDDDGILVNLASNEMQKLFDWKRVKKELSVISPSFKVETLGILRTITVYSKICRGAMTRYIIQNKITDPDELEGFDHIGFTFEGGTETAPIFAVNL